MPRGDAAFSDTTGVFLMVAVCTVMAGGVYLYAFGNPMDAAAPDFDMSSLGGIDPQGRKAFTVTAAPEELLWNDLLVKVDGRPLGYDATLTAKGYCVAATTGACLPSVSAAAEVAAGQFLHVHDPNLAQKEVQIVDARSGEVLLTLKG